MNAPFLKGHRSARVDAVVGPLDSTAAVRNEGDDIAASGIIGHTICCVSIQLWLMRTLPFIPGDCVAAAAKALPDAEKDKEAFREVVIDVPGSFKVRIRFERFHFKRRKMSPWFWTPHSARKIE
jgi:hypothetical protein